MSDLVLVKEAELEKEIAPIVAQAKALVVATPEQRTFAVMCAKELKARQKKVAELFDPIEEAQKALRKTTIESRGKLDNPLKEGEAIIKAKVLAFDAKVEKERREEEARLQAKADEEARKERERLEKQAEKLKTPELREERMAQAAAVTAPVITVASVVEKAKGESTRGKWKARLTDKKALVAAAHGGNDLAMSFLAYDESAANRTATATKGAVPVPGVEWYEEKSLALGKG